MENGNMEKLKQRGKLYTLLVCILTMLLVFPFFQGRVWAGKLFALFFSWILVSGVFAVSETNRRNRIIAIVLAVPTVILLWFDAYKMNIFIDIPTEVLVIVFCFFTVGRIVTHLVETERVTVDTLAGAASAYLLIGISWGILYTFIETIFPGSYISSGVVPVDMTDVGSAIYFSFTTLTTLGYGDIIPATSRAQMIAMIEAVTGVLFVAFLVSRLVGMYLYHINRKVERKSREAALKTKGWDNQYRL